LVPSPAVRGFDTDTSVSGGLVAGGAGQVSENAAACRADVTILARLPSTLQKVELPSVMS